MHSSVFTGSVFSQSASKQWSQNKTAHEPTIVQKSTTTKNVFHLFLTPNLVNPIYAILRRMWHSPMSIHPSIVRGKVHSGLVAHQSQGAYWIRELQGLSEICVAPFKPRPLPTFHLIFQNMFMLFSPPRYVSVKPTVNNHNLFFFLEGEAVGHVSSDFTLFWYTQLNCHFLFGVIHKKR